MNQPSSTGDSALTTTRHKERACGRRRYERITADRITRGMCPRCGKARPAPDRTLCRHCGEKRRKAERARCAKAKAAGIPYGGRDAERCRAFARDRGRRRDRAARTAGGTSSSPMIPPSPRSSQISSACVSIRRPMPWWCRLMRNHRSRRSTAPNPACR